VVNLTDGSKGEITANTATTVTAILAGGTENDWDNGDGYLVVSLGKTALLPGQTATFVNYTSYTKGINGVMVDLDDLPNPAALSASDFEFRVGNDNNPGAWSAAPAPQSITVRENQGINGSDRVTVIWADNDWMTSTPEPGAIAKQWLQVTVLPTTNTGLPEEDVFYFGNAVGESGNSIVDAAVNATDEIGARNHPHWFLDPAPIEDAYDYNRDKKVDATDQIVARNNQTFFLNDLNLITVPASAGGSAAGLLAMATPGAASSSPSTRLDVSDGGKAADTSRMDQGIEVPAVLIPADKKNVDDPVEESYSRRTSMAIQTPAVEIETPLASLREGSVTIPAGVGQDTAQPLVIAAAINDAIAYRGKADLEVAKPLVRRGSELPSPFAFPPGPGYQEQASPIEPLQASSQSGTAAVDPPAYASLVEEVIGQESDLLEALWAESVWFYELEEMSAKSDSAEEAVDEVFLLYWT